MELLTQGATRFGIELQRGHLDQFELLYQELVEWNQKFNLTGITEYKDVQVQHFLDSLTPLVVMRELFEFPDLRVIDIGSGGGFPGVPLKIVQPQLELTLLESTRKKTRFLAHLVDALELSGVEVVWARAEEVGHDPSHRNRYHVSLARAVAEMSALAEYAMPLCQVGGVLIAQKGAEVGSEIEAAQKAFEILGGEVQGVRPIELRGLEDVRHLVVVEKVASTPEEYPRRPGMPEHRPLR